MTSPGRATRGEPRAERLASPRRSAQPIIARGNSTVTSVPSPGSEISSIVPPCASTNCLASGRPRPSARSPPRAIAGWAKRSNARRRRSLASCPAHCPTRRSAPPSRCRRDAAARGPSRACRRSHCAADARSPGAAAADRPCTLPAVPDISTARSIALALAQRRDGLGGALREQLEIDRRSRPAARPRSGSDRAHRRSARPAARPSPGSPRHIRVPLSLSFAGKAAVQHLGEAADRGQRRAQFVAHIGDEAVLTLVRRLERLVAFAQRALDAAAGR